MTIVKVCETESLLVKSIKNKKFLRFQPEKILDNFFWKSKRVNCKNLCKPWVSNNETVKKLYPNLVLAIKIINEFHHSLKVVINNINNTENISFCNLLVFKKPHMILTSLFHVFIRVSQQASRQITPFQNTNNKEVWCFYERCSKKCQLFLRNLYFFTIEGEPPSHFFLSCWFLACAALLLCE